MSGTFIEFLQVTTWQSGNFVLKEPDMKTIVHLVKSEFRGTNLMAAVSCLILSLVIFFIMSVMTREVLI